MIRPGRADQHVDAAFDLSALLLVAGSAVGQGDRKTGMLPQVLGVFRDLHGEFPGRRQDENPRLFLLAAVGCSWCLCQQSLVRGNEKGGRLAGAGLCLAGNVFLLQGQGQGAGLNWRTVFETGITNPGEHAFMKIQGIESEIAQMVISH